MYVELKTKERNQPLWPGFKYVTWVCCYFLLFFTFNKPSTFKFQFNPGRETENQSVDALSPLFFFSLFIYLFIYSFICLFFIHLFIAVFIYLFTVDPLLSPQGRYVPESLVKITQG